MGIDDLFDSKNERGRIPRPSPALYYNPCKKLLDSCKGCILIKNSSLKGKWRCGRCGRIHRIK